RRLLACLAQRPERGRARPRPAVAEYGTGAPLEHRFGLFDHVRGHPFAAERNVMIGETGVMRRLLDLRAGRLIRRLPVGTIVDDGDETGGLDRCHVVRADLRRDADVLVDPLQFQIHYSRTRPPRLPGSLYTNGSEP